MNTEKLIEDLRQLFFYQEPFDHMQIEVSFFEETGNIRIVATTQYSQIKLRYSMLETLQKISKFTDRPEVDVNEYAVTGCETCDFGSEYGYTFLARN